MSQVVTKHLGLKVPYYRSVDWYDDMVYSFKVIDDIAKVYHNDITPGGSSIIYSILSNGQRKPAITISSVDDSPTVQIAGFNVQVKTGAVPVHSETADEGKYLLVTDGADQWVLPLYKVE